MSTQPLPRWLADEPQIQALLHAVLNRFDLQAGETRQQRLYFSAEKYLPALTRLDERADQLWHLAHELERSQLLIIKTGKRGPYDADWKGAKLGFTPESEETLRTWLDRPREESALHSWRKTVEKHAELFPNGIENLLKYRITIPGFNDEQVVRAFAKLRGITTPYTLRQLSALFFGGDSKVLDFREELVRSLFPKLPLKLRPVVISVKLPDMLRGVLFIENQDTYSLALSGHLPDTQELAIVYASGFRSSAERIREKDAALLHYYDKIFERTCFEEWWFNSSSTALGPIYFFGDLDFSGMKILATLRQRFGDVRAWQPGYKVLLEIVRNGGGHNADAADKQLQLDPGSTGCRYADEVLLPAIREHGFIDQEVFNNQVL